MIFLGLFIFFVCMFAYLRHKSTAAEEAAAETVAEVEKAGEELAEEK